MSKRTTKPTMVVKKKMIKEVRSPKRVTVCSQMKLPETPCRKRLIREINMIRNQRKTFGSLRGDLILAKRKAIKIRRKGIKTEP